MQLAKAIEAWVATKGSGLSAATKRDIRTIGLAAADCGLAKLECSGLSAADQALIVSEASQGTALGDGAIDEFLEAALAGRVGGEDAEAPEEKRKGA